MTPTLTAKSYSCRLVRTALQVMLLAGTVAHAENEDRALASLRPAAAAPVQPGPSLRPMGDSGSRVAERLDWQRRQHTAAAWADRLAGTAWLQKDAELLDAARDKRWQQVRTAISQRDANPNPINARGDHLLAIAAQAGQDEIVRLLLQRGADLERTGADGFSALGAAAFAGHRSTVRLLLRQGADPARWGAGGQTALHLAAAAGQLAVVEEFVRQRVDLEVLNRQRDSALDLAAAVGQQPVMEQLLRAGADLTRAGMR